MRLLFVHEVNWRRKVVYEIHDYPELLSLRGHEVVFVDFAENERRDGLRSLIDLRTETRIHSGRAHAGSRVEVRTPGRVLPPPLDRVAASTTHVPEIRRALKHGRFDAVILYSVPTNGWQTVLMARMAGVPLLFRAIDVSHQLRRTLFAPLVRRAEHFVYRNADAISTHNEALRAYCIAHGAGHDSTGVEYPGLDLVRFSPAPRPHALCDRYGITPEEKVVLFMGTLYRFAGLDWFLNGAAEIINGNPNIRILILGGGEEEVRLKEHVRRAGMESRVLFTGFIDYPELADHLRLADIAINSFEPTLVTNCALPGKVLQYLGCGVPCVSTPLEGLRGMLSEGDGVLYRDAGDGFLQAVKELLKDDNRRTEVGAAGRRAMERLCQWSKCIEDFERAIVRAIDCHTKRGTGK